MKKVSINALLLDGLLRHNRPDLLWYKEGGAWRKISTDRFLRRAAAVGRWLKGQGIRRGDRVAIFSENRPEWHIADLGILGIGAVNVPLYFAESPARLQFILSDSEARICFVSTREQLDKVKNVWAQLPALEQVVWFSGEDASEKIVPWTQVAQESSGQETLIKFVRRARSVDPDSVATLLYTSGTTGRPKGVLLTQFNLGSNARDTYSDTFPVEEDDLFLSLLPLCHIYERTVAYSNLVRGIPIAYAESFDKVVENMNEIRPTLTAVVPRFFEKFYDRLQAGLQDASLLERKLFDWAVGVGRRALPYRLNGEDIPGLLGLQYRLADLLVYRKLRQRLGGRIRAFNSGGAPLSKPLNEFFHAIGFNIYEGYGLTETAPVIATNVLGPPIKLGTVGKIIPNVEVKIAGDGEILVRGPNVMKGYHNLEKETAEALKDGWFHTGDLGSLDQDNYLTITGRKKDIIKTAAGKMIAPQPIENSLKESRYIQNAVVVGDRRKFASALLAPNFEAVEAFAKGKGIAYNSTAELLAHPGVRELFDAALARTNEPLAQFEKIKKFALLKEGFSFEGGQLTYTQKVRRNSIEKQYAAVIDQMYIG